MRKNIGYVSQNTILYNASVKENISISENDKVEKNSADMSYRSQGFVRSQEPGSTTQLYPPT